MIALERAATQIAAGDYDAALDALLTAWRTTRAPAIADVIERLSEKVTASKPPIEGSSATKRQAPWLARAETATSADLGVLLATVGEGRVSLSEPRLEVIAARATDPRIASALVDLAHQPPFQAKSSRQFWTRLFAVVAKQADRRQIARLRALIKPARLEQAVSGSQWAASLFRRCIADTVDKLESGPTPLPLSDGQRRTLARVQRDLERQMGDIDAASKQAESLQSTAEEFLDAVAKAPTDLGIRLVFSDWLIDREDPRGEFIALQFLAESRALTPGERNRMRALTESNWRRWLAPIDKAIYKDSVRFRNGMLSACRAKHVTPNLAATLIGARPWATVEAIDNARALPAELLVDPVMKSLHTVRGLRNTTARELLANPGALVKLRELGIADFEWHSSATIYHSDRQALGEARGMPELRRLGLQFGSGRRFIPGPLEYEWLWASDLGTRLEMLLVDAEPEMVRRWLMRIARLPPPLVELVLVMGEFRMRFRRGREGWCDLAIDADGPVRGSGLVSALDRLSPSSITRIDATGCPYELDFIKERMRSRKIDVVG